MKLKSWKFANLKTSWKTNKKDKPESIEHIFPKDSKRKDLIYEAKKYLIFNNLKQSFGDSTLSGKITLDKAGKNQNNLLINISKFNDTARAGSKADRFQFVVFKPLSYCFEEAIGFDVKTSFPSHPLATN